MKQDTSICIGSMNARGLGQNEKRLDVFSWLRAKNLSICCIVDFHCKSSMYKDYIKEWGSHGVFAEGSSDSRGVAVLFARELDYEVLGSIIDKEGNYIILDLNVHGNRFTLAVIYGPNRDKPGFYDDLQNQVKQLNNSSVVMVGDWNIPMNYDLDTKGYQHRNNPKARDSLLQLMESLELFDIWRVHNEEVKKFTWFKNSKQMARLDYFLITSDWVTKTVHTKISPGYRTDHSLLTLRLNIEKFPRGKGFWKFNASLLKDENYVKLVKETIHETVERYKVKKDKVDTDDTSFSIDDQMFFEMLKLAIRGRSIAYSSRVKRQKEERERGLEKEIETLYEEICGYNCTTNMTESMDALEHKKAMLEELRLDKMRAAMFRAKVKEYEEGEKPTRYFFNLEKRNGSAKTMTQVKVNDRIETNPEKILEAQREYYQNLYSERPINEEISKQFLQDKYIRKLNNEQGARGEGVITLKEVKSTLAGMANNKSPGSDGFTVEFYKFFINDIGNYIVNSLNCAYHKGVLSETQRLGILSCIPKGDKPREFLSNWRPISLLNIDYKILSGILATRIKPTLAEIIDKIQKGFLDGRCISENCRLVYDVMYELERKNKTGLLIMVDFEKAFDSVNWSYLKKILDLYNFGDQFKHWINVLYNKSCSVVLNGGHFTKMFDLGSGCRQGDPLSPYLFLLAIEPLAMKIKSEPNIRGIKIGDTEHKLGQYADDMFMLQDGTQKSLEKAFEILEQFEKVSGLKVNVEKSIAVWIGKRTNPHDTISNRIRLKWTDHFTLLGIHFDVKLKSMVEQNFNLALGKMESVMQFYRSMSLSMLGKVTVIKSLVIPKLVHVLQVLPLPGKGFVDTVNKLIRDFIWNKGKSRISLIQLQQDYEDGGLKVPNVPILNAAIKISWIKRLCTTEGGYQDLFQNSVSYLKKELWCMDKITYKKIMKETKNPFWCEVLKSWWLYYESLPDIDALNCPLWNSFLTNKNVVCRKKEFIQKGVLYVNDLVKENGGFMSVSEFKERYGVNINYLDYQSIIHSLPIEWRQNVRKTKRMELVENKELDNILAKDKVCKWMYQKLLKLNDTKHYNVEKWSAKLEENISEERIKDSFVMLRKVTSNSILRSFQYQIVKRAIVTNKYLAMCRIKDSDKCYYCGQCTETIEHLFWECPIINDLWNECKDSLIQYIDLGPHMTKANILLGTKNTKETELINIIFILVKRYIYVQRCREKVTSRQGLIAFIKKHYTLETNTVHVNINRWSPLSVLFE